MSQELNPVDAALIIVEAIDKNKYHTRIDEAAHVVNRTKPGGVANINECLVLSGPILAAEVRRLRDLISVSALREKEWAETVKTAQLDAASILTELDALREGFDPKEKLPEDHRSIFVEHPYYGGWRTGHRDGDEFIPTAGEVIPFRKVVRWYPLPGGHR